ncbi:MAG TPA: tricarballylate/proton symporter TcuC [Magnetospirillaceae bacterium]|nr:tricarballylate/proton symporter TcuC [Magnetospirillaceae bacterium]
MAARVARVICGNFLEMFDFFVYGFYASIIAKVLFPAGDDYFSLMLSWVTFGVGFLMRPLGAVVLGAFADKHGRRAGLLLSLALMSAGVVCIGFVPSYASIGPIAPIIVLIGRLLQGFSAGAESGTVSVYLAEIAPPARRGLFASLQTWSQQVAVIFAATIGIVLRLNLTPQQMTDWGWRVPFIIGSLLIPFLLIMRRSIEETEEFKARRRHPGLAEIWRTLWVNWRLVGTAMMMITLTAVMFYLITAYMAGFGSEVLHLSQIDSFLATICTGLANLIWIPIMGSLSDRVGRAPILMVAAATIAVVSYPCMEWLVAEPSLTRLLMVEMFLGSLYGMWQGVLIISIVEIMPAEVRAAGWSVAYSLTYAIFGGFTPALVTWLIHETGDKGMPGAALVPAAVIGLIGTILARKHLGQARVLAASAPSYGE